MKKGLLLFLVALCLAGSSFAAPPIVAPDTDVQGAQYKLDGAWYGAADYDPSEIGPDNFQTLKNMRYGNKHPEGISGYTVQNGTAITTYTDVKSGVQLRTNRDNPSRVIVAAANSGGTAVQLYESTDAIPGAVTFTALTTGRSGGASGSAYNDTSGNTPRLASIPQRQIAYSNEEASYIYGGPQMDCAAFFLCDDTDLTNPRDYWSTVKNSLSSDTVTIDSTGTDVFTVHSTRPLQGVWFTVVTPNASASTLTGHVWTSSGWVALGNPTDGTTDTGVALAQSGELVFDSTVATAARKHFEGTYFFCYRFQLDAGSAVISHVQVDMPFQPILDSWDGVPRNAAYAGINFSGDDEDFTPQVVETSYKSVPIGMLLDGLTSGDEIYFIFEDRATAIQITMLADLVNDVAATLSGAYWDGDSFAAMSNFVDGTSNGTKTFKKSGLLSWTPPAATAEFPTTIGKVTGWCYRFVPSATLTGTHGDSTDSVVVDVVTGVPAPLDVGPYKFHSEYKGRHLGCGAISDKEGNRVDFTAPYAPDVWNGFQSSNNKTQSLYLGTGEDLNCGNTLYNRYGSVDRLFEVWVGCSDSKTFQVKASDTEGVVFDYDVVSESVGCPAPATFTSANIGFESSVDGAKRNILLWVDSSGPYSYDGSYLDPIPGLERYFDQNDSLYVGADLSDAAGWFDPIYREWNLILPGDVWVVYDLEKKKWYQKDAGTATTPTSGFQVVDVNGSKYSYGCLSTGEIARLEYGTTWDGASIDQEFEVGDFWPSQNIWQKTVVRRLKLVATAISEDHDVQIYSEVDTKPSNAGAFQYYDGEFTYYDGEFTQFGSVVSTMSLNATGGERLVRKTLNMNQLGWSHAFGFKVSTTDSEKAFQPIGWGIEYFVEREDH